MRDCACPRTPLRCTGEELHVEAEPKPVTARSQWLEVLGEPGAKGDGAGKGKSAFFKKIAGLRQMGSPDQDTWKSLRQVGSPHQL